MKKEYIIEGWARKWLIGVAMFNFVGIIISVITRVFDLDCFINIIVLVIILAGVQEKREVKE